MSVPILDRQQTPGSGVGLPAVAAVGDDDVATGQASGTQQVTDGVATAAAATLASCGQKLITTSTDDEHAPPQSRLSTSCTVKLVPSLEESMRTPFDGCDKNKQRDGSDAQDACNIKQTLEHGQADLRGARQSDHGASGDEGARSTRRATDPQSRFRPPNPIQETPSSPSQATEQHQASSNTTAPMISATFNDRPLAMTRHHSTIEVSNTPVEKKMIRRKTSVFSHSGFMSLHKLDQSAIQQHAIVSGAATATNGTNGAIAAPPSQQADKSQDQSAAPKTTTAASSSPRQPYRSDTLGSTGSSRASSCDEPTIVSPAKLLAPTSLVAHEHKPGKNLIPIPSSQDSNVAALSPLESLAKRIVAEHGLERQGQGEQSQHNSRTPGNGLDPTMMQCDTEDDDNDMKNAHDRGAKGQESDTSDDDDDELDDDEDDDECNNKNIGNRERPQRVSLSTNFRESLKIPPFESIKTQIKKNSIPNAEDIKRHIEKLISRNEEIIDNWNQVSIRSYNSSASGAATESVSSAATTKPAAAAAVASTTRRPSKRWSTTALCSKPGSSGIMLTQPSPSASASSLGDQIGRPSMSGIERKRSQIHHQPVRRVSQQHKPLTIFNEPQSHQASTRSQQQQQQQQQQQHLLVQTTMASGSAYPHVSHSMPSSPKQIGSLLSDVHQHHQQQVPASYQQQQQQHHHHQETIESAIENLSLKKRHSGENGVFSSQIDNQPASTASTSQDSDLVMAALLVERQRQQQLLDEYLRQRAASDRHHHQMMMNFSHLQQNQVAPNLPNPILDHYQRQQLTSQQQLIEHQLSLRQLAELENELLQQRQQLQQQQAMADLMGAASLNLPQAMGQFGGNQQLVGLESQLLNEYLAKMILSRPQPLELAATKPTGRLPSPSGGGSGNGSGVDQLNGARPVGPFQVSPTSPSRVYLGHGSELQTQSLDSATPSYRCDACDISFWTRDLLNYHSMTSCSARTGSRPSKPMAFSFNQPNGFDSATTMTSTDPIASQSMTARQNNNNNNNSMQSPTVIVSCADTVATSAAAATSYQQHKPVGPARRRTHDELNAPSSPYMATYRDLLIKTQDQIHRQRQLSTSSIDHRPIREQQPVQLSPLGPGKSGALVPPKSPHKSRESAELAWQQRLDELSRLKQRLLLNGGEGGSALAGLANLAADQQQQQQQLQLQGTQQQQQITLSGNENQESKLPIKKRKISEPNMKY